MLEPARPRAPLQFDTGPAVPTQSKPGPAGPGPKPFGRSRGGGGCGSCTTLGYMRSGYISYRSSIVLCLPLHHASAAGIVVTQVGLASGREDGSKTRRAC